MNTPRVLSRALLTFTLALAGCGSSGHSGSSPPPPPPDSGPEFLYSAPLSDFLNTSLTAEIDPSNGGFSSVSVTTVPFFCSGGIIVVGGEFLYISVPTTTCPVTGGQVYGYAINPTTGLPTPLGGSPFSSGLSTSPEGMATVPNSYFLYIADAGGIDAFTVEPSTGVLTPISGSPFASGNNPQLVVDPSGKFLYASDDGVPGGVFAFTIDSGALTPVPGSPFQVSGQTASTQPYGIVDTGKFVYAALYATNQIAGFSVDSATGALTSLPGSPFPAGVNPVVLALANNFLYCVNSQDGSISGYAINSDGGALTPIPGSPFISDSLTIVPDPSGKYLYVSTTVGILGFNIDSTTGALTQGAASVSNDGGLWLTVAQLPSAAAQ